MTTKLLSAEIYTSSHRILGRLNPGSTGLFSYLNIPTTSYVEIEGGHLTRLHQPEKLVVRHSKLWLVKREIVAVLLNSRKEIGPTGVAKRGYTSTAFLPVHVVLGGYELRGSLEIAGKFEFGSLLFEGNNLFVPLFDAELEAILIPEVRSKAQGLLFNREMVDAMGMMRYGGSGLQTESP
ncbi:MAG: hypothetical protein PVF70_05920 [Anaerolineales bacterium]|jgi:hypothetical protein